MKHLLTVLLAFSWAWASGQAHYNPSYTPMFTVASKPYAISQGAPVDGRSYKVDSINFLYRPYNGTSEVLSYLNVTMNRIGQFPIEVNVGGSLNSNGSFTGGYIYEYWFRGGTADTCLVLKSFFPPNLAGFLLATNNLSDVQSASTSRSNLGLGAMATQGTTASSTDLMGTWPGSLVVQSVQGHNLAYLLNYNNLTNTPTIPAQFNPIAGSGISLSGSYPNITFSAPGGTSFVRTGNYLVPQYTTPTQNPATSGFDSVGINTTHPDAPFQVSGLAHVASMKVDNVPNTDSTTFLQAGANGTVGQKKINPATIGADQAVVSYGELYDSSSWNNLNSFTLNGASASVSGSKIAFSGGQGLFTQSLDWNYFSCLEKWSITMEQTVGTIGGSSVGLAPGMRSYSYNGYALFNIGAYLNLTNGGVPGTLFLAVGTGAGAVQGLATSTTALSFSSGDRIVIHLVRSFYTVTATAYNLTTNAAPVTCSYTFTTLSSSFSIPNTGKFCVYNFGGNNVMDSLAISSQEDKNATVACIGDSKTVGYNALYLSSRFATILSNKLSNIVLAGGGDQTADVISRIPEVIALNPRYVVLNIGRNDIADNVPSATIYANYDTIYARLSRAGITVYNLLPLYETNVNQNGLTAHITSTYPASTIIDSKGYIFSAAPSVVVSSDNIHPTPYYHQLIATAILDLFQYNQNRYYPPPLSFQQVLSSNPNTSITPVLNNGLTLFGTTPGLRSDSALTILNGVVREVAFPAIDTVITTTSSISPSAAYQRTTIILNASSGTITLPDPTAASSRGKYFYVRVSTSGQTATVATAAGSIETSLGAFGATVSISGAPNTGFVTNGTNWIIAN